MRHEKLRDISILTAYVALIYSTLPLTPRLFFFLWKRLGPSLKVVINISLVSIGIVILYLFYERLKRRRLTARLGLLVVIAVYSLLIIYYTPIAQERVHLVEYGFLGYLALRVFRTMRSRDMKYLAVIATIIIVGYADELIQRMLPSRVYELRDVYMNILSGLLGLALLRLLGYEESSRLDNGKD